MTTLPIYLLIVCAFTGLSARNLALPLYAHDLGVGRANVGFLFAASALTSAVVSIPSGRLVDRFGRRNVLVAAAVASGLTQLALANTTSFRMMLAWQVVGGIGAAAIQTGATAAVIDAVPHERLGRATGWLTFSIQGGNLAGPALAGLLTRLVDLPADLAIFSAFYIPTVLLSLLVPDGRTRSSANKSTRLRDILVRRGVLALLVGTVAGMTLYGTLQAFLPIFAKEQLRLPAASIGLLIGILAVFNGLSRIFSGRLIDRVDRRVPLIAGCLIAFAGALAILPWLSGFWGPAVLCAATGPLIAICFVAVGTTFNQLAPPEARGLSSGLYGTVIFGGVTAGPLLYGPVMQGAGYQAGFAACAAGAVVLTAVMLVLRTDVMQGPRGRAVTIQPGAGA